LSLKFAGAQRKITITVKYPRENYYDIGVFQIEEITEDAVHHDIFKIVSKTIASRKFRLNTLMDNLAGLMAKAKKNVPASKHVQADQVPKRSNLTDKSDKPAPPIAQITPSGSRDKIIVVNDNEQADWDDEIDFETKSETSNCSIHSVKSKTFYVNREQETLVDEILNYGSDTVSTTSTTSTDAQLVATIVDEADDTANLPGEIPLPVVPSVVPVEEKPIEIEPRNSELQSHSEEQNDVEPVEEISSVPTQREDCSPIPKTETSVGNETMDDFISDLRTEITESQNEIIEAPIEVVETNVEIAEAPTVTEILNLDETVVKTADGMEIMLVAPAQEPETKTETETEIDSDKDYETSSERLDFGASDNGSSGAVEPTIFRSEGFISNAGDESRSFRRHENLLDPGENSAITDGDGGGDIGSDSGRRTNNIVINAFDDESFDSDSDFNSDDDFIRMGETDQSPIFIDTLTSEKKPEKFAEPITKANLPNSIQKSQALNPNSIYFNCEDDVVGMYYDMKYLIKKSFDETDITSLIESTLKIHSSDNLIGISDRKKGFSEVSLVRVIANEVRTLMSNGNDFYELEFVKGNLYNWNIRFKPKFFANCKNCSSSIITDDVVVNFHLDAKLYPFFPPKVRIIEPVVDYETRIAFATIPCLSLENWGPTSNLKLVIDQIGKLSINVMASEIDARIYELHGLLLDLIMCGTFDFVKKTSSPSSTSKYTKKKSVWPKGLGYGGTKGASKWDVAATLKIKDLQAKMVSLTLEKILLQISKILFSQQTTKSSDKKKDLLNLLTDSPFVANIRSYFSDTLLRVMLEDLPKFNLFVDSLRIFPNDCLHVFNSEQTLLQLLKPIYDDCQIYLKLISTKSVSSDKSQTKSISSVKNFVSFYHRLELYQKSSESKNLSLLESDQSQEKTDAELYVEVLKPLQFITVSEPPPSSKTKQKVQTPTAQCVSRIVAELAEMQGTSNRLHLNFSSGVFFKNYEDDITQMEFIICGTEGTPYDSGCFLFSMVCPHNYPTTNPYVTILTTGNGSVNFNPNLFSHGLVCLSLLGTLSADRSESWIPGTSNMMQIILSIQSLVMNSEPYLNSLAHLENMTPKLEQESLNYSATIIASTMKFAITEQILNPPHGFEETIKQHFKIKSSYIKARYDPQILIKTYESVSKNIKTFQKVYDDMCQALDSI
jgi:ubiquitin-protein ligase